MYIVYHAKCPLFLSNFNETCIFLTDFRHILKYKILRKFVQRELSCSMRRRTDGQTEGQTDKQAHTTNQIVAFRNFAIK